MVITGFYKKNTIKITIIFLFINVFSHIIMTKEEKKIYELITEEEPYCQICGSTSFLHRHHIRYGACGRKTYLGNIIVLCEECHRIVHSNKKKWQPILIDKANKHEKEMGRL